VAYSSQVTRSLVILFKLYKPKQRKESGLIAQDVWYDCPELRHIISLSPDSNPDEEKPFTPEDIQQDPDYDAAGWGSGAASVAYTNIIPYLVKSNQEIYTELQAEKAKTATLETQLTSVLARLDALEAA